MSDPKIIMDKKNIVSNSKLGPAGLFKIEPASSVPKKTILTFFRKAYQDQFNALDYHDPDKITAKWQWRNIDNPNIIGNLFPSWICSDSKSGDIVGHFGTMPVSFKYKNRYFPALWGIDLIVPAQFRKLGIASFLVDGVLKKTKDSAGCFLLAGLNDYVVEKVFKKVGFAHLGFVPIYVRINNPVNIVAKQSSNKFLSLFLGHAAKFMLKLFYGMSCILGPKCGRSNVDISEISGFDKTFDKLWENASKSISLAVKRDSIFLNWRFINQPYWKYKIFKAQSKVDGKLLGYIVLREGKSRGLNLGVITDIFADPNDNNTVSSLLSFALKYFQKNDAIDLVRCDMLNKNISRGLKKFGFISIRSHSHFMITNICEDIELGFVANRDNWFITYADCDLDLSGRG